MPIYLITQHDNDRQRLVRAANKSAAIRHVAADMLGAQLAAQDTLAELLQNGLRVEDAGQPSTDEQDEFVECDEIDDEPGEVAA